MILVCLFALCLIFVVSTPNDKRVMHQTSCEIIQIVKTKISILWDKVRGKAPVKVSEIDRFYIEEDESDSFDWDDEDQESLETTGENDIFVSDSIDCEIEWDDRK